MAVTGLGTGTDFSGLNDALKNVYTGPFNNTIEGESEVNDAFMDAGDFETIDGPDGKQINIGHYMSAGGGVSFSNEDDYLPDAKAPLWKQGNLTIKEMRIRADISGRTMSRAKEGPAAFATWADMVLPEKAKRGAFHLDRALLGTGTGIIGRISGTPDGTGDSIQSAFGISGLGSALKLFLVGDSFRYSPNADGSSPRTGVVDVASISYSADTFDTTVGGSTATATSAADTDYVFLGSTNVNSSGTREIMGLEGIVDDGTNVSTFQGLTRSSYPAYLNAQIINSTTSYGGTLSEDLVDYADTLSYERAGGKCDILLTSRNGGRSFWKSLKGDRIINDPQGVYAGGKRKLQMILGDRALEVKMARKVPDSRAFLLERATLKRFQIGAGRWDDTTGSIWRQVSDSTGTKHAFFAYWVKEVNYGCVFPARNVKITNLATA